MKICSKCGINQPLTNFIKEKRTKSGIRSRCRSCDRVYREQNKNRIKKSQEEWYITNRDRLIDKAKMYNKQNKEKGVDYKKLPSKSKSVINKLPLIYKPLMNNEGYISVKCYKCGIYFTPTNAMISHCISAYRGNGRGQHNLYCSQNCKDDCEVFYQIKYPKGDKPYIDRSREIQPQLREIVLERDNYVCQSCGEKRGELHCHHYTGVEVNPIESADVDNCITLCVGCHQRIHSSGQCDVRRQPCEVINV